MIEKKLFFDILLHKELSCSNDHSYYVRPKRIKVNKTGKWKVNNFNKERETTVTLI